MGDKTKKKQQIIPLDEEALKRVRQTLEGEELSLENLRINKDMLERQIKSDLLMRNARLQLRQLESEIQRISNNIKVYQKQIREKQVRHFGQM